MISLLLTLLAIVSDPMTHWDSRPILFHDLTKFYYHHCEKLSDHHGAYLSLFGAHKDIQSDETEKGNGNERFIGYLEGKFGIRINTAAFYENGDRKKWIFGDVFHICNEGVGQTLEYVKEYNYVENKGIVNQNGKFIVEFKHEQLSNSLGLGDIYVAKNKSFFVIVRPDHESFVLIEMKKGKAAYMLDFSNYDMRHESGLVCMQASIIIKGNDVYCYMADGKPTFIKQNQQRHTSIYFSASITHDHYLKYFVDDIDNNK